MDDPAGSCSEEASSDGMSQMLLDFEVLPYVWVLSRMTQFIDDPNSDATLRDVVVGWYGQFQNEHYECMRLVVEAFRDGMATAPLRDLVQRQGRIIHTLGGDAAMVAIYYICSNFIVDADFKQSTGIMPFVESVWDGIGTWRRLPSYANVQIRMREFIDKTIKASGALFSLRGRVIAWRAQFSEPHYECMCRILQGFRDDLADAPLRELVHEQGRIVHGMGGDVAMVSSFYICRTFIIDQESSTEKGYMHAVKEMWDGLGTWQV
jgi:hypothetical protein